MLERKQNYPLLPSPRLALQPRGGQAISLAPPKRGEGRGEGLLFVVHPAVLSVSPTNPAPRHSAYIIFKSVSAISLGVAATPMPASLNAAIFAAAVPLPPLTMAPA